MAAISGKEMRGAGDIPKEKWEYLSVVVSWDREGQKWQITGGVKTATIQEYLNTCGSQGWELVAFNPDDYAQSEHFSPSAVIYAVTGWTASRYRAIFKRRLQ